MYLNEFVELHNELNPKLWDKNNKILPDVNEKLLQIIEQFNESSPIDLNMVDAVIVGSNASYNYTDTSDIDFHIIVNSEFINASEELIQILYDYTKSKFNSDYNITIHGLEVELYIQDVNSTVQSNGMYSVLQNKWIKFPKKIQPLDINIDDIYSQWETNINNLLINGTADDIKSAINKIYLIRRNSVNNVGEFGRGNILFKKLRSNGYIDKLKQKYKELVSDDLSLEAFQQHKDTNAQEDLDEDSKNQILQKQKSSKQGLARFKKRMKCKVITSSKNFNNIDMNKLFTQNILTVDLDVRGETDTYQVKTSYGGFLDIIHDQLKSNNATEVDLRMITRALITGFNRNDVYVHCSCPDFSYRFGYYATKNKINSGDPENRPSNITNPDDKLGSCCKHAMRVLNNTSWILKVATVIFNYIKYMKKYKQDLYETVIYPALYQKEFVDETREISEPTETTNETTKETTEENINPSENQ